MLLSFNKYNFDRFIKKSQKKKKSPKSTPDTAKEVLETTEVVPETPQEAACVRSSGDGVDTPKLDLNGTFEVASNLQQTMLDPSTPVTYGLLLK